MDGWWQSCSQVDAARKQVDGRRRRPTGRVCCGGWWTVRSYGWEHRVGANLADGEVLGSMRLSATQQHYTKRGCATGCGSVIHRKGGGVRHQLRIQVDWRPPYTRAETVAGLRYAVDPTLAIRITVLCGGTLVRAVASTRCTGDYLPICRTNTLCTHAQHARSRLPTTRLWAVPPAMLTTMGAGLWRVYGLQAAAIRVRTSPCTRPRQRTASGVP